jgi:hypothetical protein
MKNNILIFLLGIFVTISIAATVPNTGLLTVKPAKPLNTVLITSDDNFNSYIKAGYIVKTISATNGFYVIILEKY